jgi:hypothetical protein
MGTGTGTGTGRRLDCEGAAGWKDKEREGEEEEGEEDEEDYGEAGGEEQNMRVKYTGSRTIAKCNEYNERWERLTNPNTISALAMTTQPAVLESYFVERATACCAV